MDDDPRVMLNATTRTTEREAMCKDGISPYEQLDRFYQRVIEHAFAKTAAENTIERFRTVMGAVTLLYDTLPACVLERLLHIDNHEICMVLSGFHSLIIVPDDDGDIHLFHPLFRDFMT
jgi:hypothetical protein